MLAIAIATVLIRAPNFGDPSYHIDEQFYLLVGHVVKDGGLPYVDIWDRKPLGLFLIYAAIAALGGSGVATYHAVASLFVFATAFVLASIGRRAAGAVGGTLCGIFYVVALEALAGGGGQSPIFYNLPIALAFLIILKILDRPKDDLVARGAVAMALCSLAVFTKPSAAVESLAFGVVLLAILYRRCKSFGAVASAGALFAAIGLAPHALAFGGYALAGHGDAFWFANVESIFLKPPLPAPVALGKLSYLAAVIMPTVIVAIAGLGASRWRFPVRAAAQTRFTALWLAAALTGFLPVPGFFDHYALPVAAPLAVAAAPLFARGAIGAIAWAIPVLWSLSLVGYPNFAATQRSIAGIAKARAVIERHRKGGCMYMFDGPIILYALTGACRPTAYVFPEHLNLERERTAIGIDAAAEMARIVAARPRIIVTATDVLVGPANAATTRVVRATVTADYTLAGVVRTEVHRSPRNLEIWVRRDRVRAATH